VLNADAGRAMGSGPASLRDRPAFLALKSLGLVFMT
jgi:hypothetical protein